LENPSNAIAPTRPAANVAEATGDNGGRAGGSLLEQFIGLDPLTSPHAGHRP